METADSLYVEQCWEQHHNLVKWTTWKVIKRYGGDFDELFSEALVLFTDATLDYEPILGSLSNWIQFKVFHGLKEIKRTEARRLRIAGPMSGDLSAIYKHDSYSESLLRDLSEDARFVLAVFRSLDLSRFKNKSLAKIELRKALWEEDWDNDKVNECFREIEEAL